jgi:hypothetical protein
MLQVVEGLVEFGSAVNGLVAENARDAGEISERPEPPAYCHHVHAAHRDSLLQANC